MNIMRTNLFSSIKKQSSYKLFTKKKILVALFVVVGFLFNLIIPINSQTEWDCSATTNEGTFKRNNDCTISGSDHVSVLNTLEIDGINTDMNNLIIITAASKHRHFYLNNANAKLILRYIKLVGGDVSSYNDDPDRDGGSILIYTYGGELNLYSSIVFNNKAGLNGGGIYAYGAYGSTNKNAIHIYNSIIHNNEATGIGGGGGIYMYSAVATIYNTTIDNNQAGDGGGGMYIEYSDVTMKNTIISHNDAYNGGGLYINGDSTTVITLRQSSFINNDATNNGDEIYTIYGSLTISLINTYFNNPNNNNNIYVRTQQGKTPTWKTCSDNLCTEKPFTGTCHETNNNNYNVGVACACSITNNFDCVVCGIGKLNPLKSQTYQTACKKCGVGKFNKLQGQSNCTSCGVGKFNDLQGQSNEKACKTCGVGKYTNVDQSNCNNCGIGKFNNLQGQSNEIACKKCGVGKFNDLQGQTSETSCKSCPINFLETCDVDYTDCLFTGTGSPNLCATTITFNTETRETHNDFRTGNIYGKYTTTKDEGNKIIVYMHNNKTTELQLNALKTKNILIGDIPIKIADYQQYINNFNIQYNSFNYPPPKPIIELCKVIPCEGIPPGDCSGFKNSVPSIDLQTCVPCTDTPIWMIITLLIVMGAIMFFALRKLVQYTEKYPGTIGGTIASISIISSHGQTMLVIGHMDLSWPVEVQKAQRSLDAFTLNLPDMIHLQCLFGGANNPDASNFTIIIWTIIFATFCILFFVPKVIKCMPKCCFNDEKKHLYVDKVYNILSMTMSFLAIKFTKVLLYYYNRVLEGIIPKLLFLCIIIPVFSYIFFKFYREMRVMASEWDGKLYSCLQPLKMPPMRLQRRLIYLTKRYATHAPYYQFLIWARQISILVIISIVNIKTFPSSYQMIIGICAFIICSIAFYLHIKIKPFKYQFQNRMEKWLLLTNIVLIFTATLYSEVLRLYIKNNSNNAWSWIFSFIMLSLIFGSLIGSSIYFHLWRKLYKSLKTMWKDTHTSSHRKNSLIELNDGDGSSGGAYHELDEDLLGNINSDKIKSALPVNGEESEE